MEPTSNNDDQAVEERGATFDTSNANMIVPSLDRGITTDSRAIPDVHSGLRVLALDEDLFLESMEAIIEAYGIDDQDFSIDSSASEPRPHRHTESSSSSVSHPEIYARGFDSLPLDVLDTLSLGALIGGDKYEVAPYATYIANVTIALPIPRTQMSAHYYATQEIRLFFGEPSENSILEKLRDAMVTREKERDAKTHEREQWLHDIENQVEELFGAESKTEGEDHRILEGLDDRCFKMGF